MPGLERIHGRSSLMKIARNQPCPCGSGRKYKSCCMLRDDADRSAAEEGAGVGRRLRLPDHVREEARRQPEWEADVLGLPVPADSPRSYAVAVLVCAGPVVVGVDQRAFSAAEPARVAELIHAVLADAARAVGTWPDRVLVRDPEVATALAGLLGRPAGPLGRGDPPAVEALFDLDALDAAAAALLVHLTGGETAWPPVAVAPTWAAWGLPEEDVRALFAALSAYYRAAPWELIGDVPPLTASWPDGEEWTLAVLGAAGVARGVAVYADEEDYDAALSTSTPEDSTASQGNWILGLTCVERGELPRSMQREIARAGWEVAAPDAYPLLFPMLTPGGGITRRIAHRLTESLEAVASLTNAERGSLGTGAKAAIEGPGGVRVDYPGEDPEDWGVPARIPPELEGLVAELQSGRFTTEEEAAAFMESRLAELNTTPMSELSGLSPSQAQALLDDAWDGSGPLHLADDLSLDQLAGADFLHNARTLLAAVHGAGGVPATAAGNLKRAFVADMLDAMRWPDGWLEMIRSVSRVMNEGDAYPLHTLRVVLGVAGLLKQRRSRFSVTARGRDLLDETASGRLMAHLFRTYFVDFNIGYGGRGPDTADLQYGVPLFLARLPREAREWIGRDRLAELLLPPRPAASGTRSGSIDAIDLRRVQLSVHVLHPLARFGLLEERHIGGRPPFAESEVRTTPLFERFIRVEWGDDGYAG